MWRLSSFVESCLGGGPAGAPWCGWAVRWAALSAAVALLLACPSCGRKVVKTEGAGQPGVTDYRRGLAADGRGQTGLAMALWRRAAKAGNGDAADQIGDLYAEGRGTQRSEAKAMLWYRRAAARGSAAAMGHIGIAYMTGRGVGRVADYGKALRWFRRAAAKGSAVAMLIISHFYERGEGVPRSELLAKQWRRRGRARLRELVGPGNGAPGWVAAHTTLVAPAATPRERYSAAFRAGNEAFSERHYARAISIWRGSARRGDAAAMWGVGYLYAHGDGVARNYERAMAWWRKGAAAGSGRAMYEIAGLYRRGDGVARDYARAMTWDRRAVAAGSHDGMYGVGLLYERGLGVPRSFGTAAAWYWRALAAPDPSVAAVYRLGRLYAEGRGVPKSASRARRWFGLAARMGYAPAERALEKGGRPP